MLHRPAAPHHPLLFSSTMCVMMCLSGAIRAQSAEKAAAMDDSAALVRADAIRETVAALTAPAMEGRGTGQPGGAAAAQWIAERMKRMGLRPLGDPGSFLQKVPIREFQIAPTSLLRIGGREFRPDTDFTSFWALRQSQLRPRMEAKGPLVFAGYGISAPALGRDDLAGADLRGKVVVILPGLPRAAKGPEWEAFGWKAIHQELARRGAVAILTLTGSDRWAVPSSKRRDIGLTAPGTRTDPALPISLYVTREVEQAMLEPNRTTPAELRTAAEQAGFRARPLSESAFLSLDIAFTEAPAPSANVVGLLPGSDPKLRQEAVVYSAHYDAFGIDSKGRIFPGAGDNALGVGNMLAIAEAMAKAPKRPRRSILFLATLGEEYGLIGAAWWTAHPTWPLARTVADLNFDGYGTEAWLPITSIYGMGLTHSNLGETLRSVALGMGLKFGSDPTPQRQAFLRGDQWEFARHGIPAVIAAGVGGNVFTMLTRVTKYEQEDYHEPTDTIRPDWDWSGPETFARFFFRVGLRLADADSRPSITSGSAFVPSARPR